MSDKEKALVIVKKAKADLDSGKISRRDFSIIMMTFGAVAGYTLFSSPANAWVATRMRKSKKATLGRTVDVCDIFHDASGVALYRMDGNANDESGNYHGTEAVIIYGGGAYERGAVFNGSTSSVINSFNPSFDNFSLSAWIRVTNLSPGSWQGIIGGNDTPSRYSYCLIFQSNGVVVFQDSTSSAASLNSPALAISNTTSFFHVCATKSGTARALYINGALVASDAGGSATITKPTTGLILGKYNGSTAQTLTGLIDQVRIFNRSITAAEVTTLYSELAPTSILNNSNPFQDASLKAMFKFDGDVTDATGTYNGTATAVTYAAGKFGNCAVFSGTAHVSTTHVMPVVFSVSMFIKLSTLAPSGGPFLIGGYGVSANNFGIQIAQTSGTVGKFFVGQYGTATMDFNTGGFIHIAVTYSSGTVKVYIDGKLFDTITSTLTFSGTTIIGSDDVAHSRPFVGSIDQVRFFNKVLTPMEVACLYCETTPLEEPMHALVDPFKDGSGKALWRLEGNALDESGNYNGTATSVTYVAGKFGRGGLFNGTTSYIATPTLTAFKTVSFWATRAVSATNYYAIISGADDSWIGYSNIDNAMRLSINAAVGIDLPLLANVTLNTWDHFVIIWTTATTIDLYKNGVFQSTTAVAGYQTTPFSYIGRRLNGLYHNGKIDQLRVFSRAITAAEVTVLYNET